MKKTGIVVLCLVVVALAAGGYYFLHRAPTAINSMPGVAPTILSLLPAQAPYVIYADLAGLRSSSFLNRLVALIPTPNVDPDFVEFVRSTGFDYTRDLDRVAIAIYPTAPLPTVIVFAEGRFDQQKIITYAMRTGKADMRDGINVYVMPASAPGGEVTLQFINANRIELVSRPSGNSPASANSADPSGAEMKERISRVEGSPVFAAVRMDAVPKDAMIGSLQITAITNSMKGVKWLTLSASGKEQDLNVALQGECDSVLDAQKLNILLGGLRSLAGIFLADPATRRQFTSQGANALTKLVKRADVSATGKRVQLAVTLTPEILDGLAAPPPAVRQPVPAKPPAATPKPAH
jgi:hypothetical protein